MAALVQRFGAERILVNSAADWGISDPLKVPKTVQVMRDRGIDESTIERIVWDNPIAFFSTGPNVDFSRIGERPNVNRTDQFNANSVLRGTPVSQS
jgi:hypothetical protein